MRSSEFCRRAGITERQMDHWRTHGWIKPTNKIASGVYAIWDEAEIEKAIRLRKASEILMVAQVYGLEAFAAALEELKNDKVKVRRGN